MKKLIALSLAAILLVSALAFAGCGNTPAETTPAATTPAETTPAETTPAATTPAETTPAETTPAETTPAETTPPEETTAATTTNHVFARFDFGTKTKAEANEWTSHEYLTEALTYNKNCLEISYTEDTIVVKALKAGSASAGITDFALCFEDIVTYDFDDELAIGWGGWHSAPWSDANVGVEGKWQGRNQYIKIRMKNNTKNNMASFRWHLPGNGYATTMNCSNLYLQGGAPTSAGNAMLTAEPSDEFFSVIYDYVWINGLSSGKTRGATNYFDYLKETEAAGSVAGNNMVWQTAAQIGAIEFYVLGAYSANYASVCDTRANIVAGATVEVDYILFGTSPEHLNSYTSYLEDAAK